MNKKLIFTKTINVLEILGYMFLLAAFIVAAVACGTVEEIPVKYDAAGNVVRYGSPGVLFFLSAAMLFCNVLISLASHLMGPEAWNMPFALRLGREILVYRDMARMLMILELQLGVFSFVAAFIMFRSWGEAIAPLSVLLCLGTAADIVLSLVVAARHNKGASKGF